MGKITSNQSPHRKIPCYVKFALSLLALCGLIFPRALGSESAMTEPQIKALCLLNFTKYVEWPAGAFADAKAPIRIGVIGEKKIATVLKAAVPGKTVGERPIEIVELDPEENADRCNVLFIGAAEAKHSRAIINAIHDKNVLTIGESEAFANAGGVITFTKKDNKVRFEVNLTAARLARLQISSKVLNLADVVHGK